MRARKATPDDGDLTRAPSSTAQRDHGNTLAKQPLLTAKEQTLPDKQSGRAPPGNWLTDYGPDCVPPAGVAVTSTAAFDSSTSFTK